MGPDELLARMRGVPTTRLVQILKDIHHGSRAPRLETPPPPDDSTAWESSRRTVAAREAELEKHAEARDRVLQNLRRTPKPVPQRTVCLAGPAGGRAVGRFLLANGARAPRELSIESRDGVAAFAPSRCRLDAGTDAEVRVEVDLAGRSSGERAELAAEVHGADGLLTLLWIDVVVE